jgi:hypothetical protein
MVLQPLVGFQSAVVLLTSRKSSHQAAYEMGLAGEDLPESAGGIGEGLAMIRLPCVCHLSRPEAGPIV